MPEPFQTASLTGFLHRPVQATGDGLVLTHGAGANCQSPLLIKIAEAIAAAGFHVFRCDLPFRQQKRTGPPRPADGEEAQRALAEGVREMRAIAAGRVFLGGHSYGGRQSSMLLAKDPQAADGLLLLSYPLHPPKRPKDLRTAHFRDIRRPALFVHGSNDPFGTPEELKAALTEIPGRTNLIVIANAGHDLRKGAFGLEASVVSPLLELTGAWPPSRGEFVAPETQA